MIINWPDGYNSVADLDQAIAWGNEFLDCFIKGVKSEEMPMEEQFKELCDAILLAQTIKELPPTMLAAVAIIRLAK